MKGLFLIVLVAIASNIIRIVSGTPDFRRTNRRVPVQNNKNTNPLILFLAIIAILIVFAINRGWLPNRSHRFPNIWKQSMILKRRKENTKREQEMRKRLKPKDERHETNETNEMYQKIFDESEAPSICYQHPKDTALVFDPVSRSYVLLKRLGDLSITPPPSPNDSPGTRRPVTRSMTRSNASEQRSAFTNEPNETNENNVIEDRLVKSLTGTEPLQYKKIE